MCLMRFFGWPLAQAGLSGSRRVHSPKRVSDLAFRHLADLCLLIVHRELQPAQDLAHRCSASSAVLFRHRPTRSSGAAKKMLQCKEPKHVALVISLFQETGVTMVNEPATDRCPHCSTAFEILCVKFRPGRTAMVAACPNCAIAFADDGTRIAGLSRPFQTIERVMDWLNRRFRYILAFLLAAVIVAALLRHGFHIYGGLTPDQIREDSLIAIPAVILLVVLLRWRKS
jgi:hypothetical protein